MEIDNLLGGLKSLARTGWMQRGVNPAEAETVASHSFEAGVLAFLIGRSLADKGVKVDPYRASVIALFHDMAEGLVGDLPKWVSQRMKTKHSLEEEAFEELNLPRDIFLEYNNRNTLEGKIAKLSEELATYLQCRRYLRRGYGVEDICQSYEKEIGSLLRMEELTPIGPLLKELLGKFP